MTEVIGWGSFALGVLLSILDAVLTGKILARGGKEKNFVLRWLMAKMGVTLGLGVPKLVSAVACGWAIYVGLWPAGIAMAVVFGYISKRNYEVLKRM